MFIGLGIIAAILVIGYFVLYFTGKYAPTWHPTVIWVRDLAFFVAIAAYFGVPAAIAVTLLCACGGVAVFYISKRG